MRKTLKQLESELRDVRLIMQYAGSDGEYRLHANHEREIIEEIVAAKNRNKEDPPDGLTPQKGATIQ